MSWAQYGSDGSQKSTIGSDGSLALWKTVANFATYFPQSSASGNYVMPDSQGPVAGNDKDYAGFDFDPADYAVLGKTLQTRIVTKIATNATDPVTSSTITFTLSRITAMAGAANILATTSSSTTLVTTYTATEITSSLSPLKKTSLNTAGLTAGEHFFLINLGAATTANSVLKVSAMFQYNHI